MTPLMRPNPDCTLPPDRPRCRLSDELVDRHERLARSDQWLTAPRPREMRARRAAGSRRGFNLIELIIALAITATLLVATMVALDASYRAYQRTTDEASSHTVTRMVMHRMLAMIRTGSEFGPFPIDPNISVIHSTFIDFVTPDGQILTLTWDETDEALLITVTDPDTGVGATHTLLRGVIAQLDGDDNPIPPFTLEYERGRTLYRATIDLTVVPDDNMRTEIDMASTHVIRMIASAMPRSVAY